MADKVTDGKILGIGFEYTRIEGEKEVNRTVYLKVPNPRNNLTEHEIKVAALNLISGENPILRTNYADNFDSDTAIITAYTEQTRSIEFDIE